MEIGSKKKGHTRKFQNQFTAELDLGPAGKGQAWGIGEALWGWPQLRALYMRSLFLSHLHPSQAIRELQEEVSRLRLRLEDSLHQPAQGSPARPASTLNRPARARARPADASASWGSHYGRWVTPKRSPLCPGASGSRETWLPRGLSTHGNSQPSPTLTVLTV